MDKSKTLFGDIRRPRKRKPKYATPEERREARRQSRRRYQERYPERVKESVKRSQSRRRAKLREYRLRYRLTHPDQHLKQIFSNRVRSQKWAKTSKGKSSSQRAYRAYIARQPERYAARFAANNAVKAGKLVKPPACQTCGWVTPHLQMHHRDYSKPLAVEWLCVLCHRYRDGKLQYPHVYRVLATKTYGKVEGDLWLILEFR